jgi:uncharacterized integral membrane protein
MIVLTAVFAVLVILAIQNAEYRVDVEIFAWSFQGVQLFLVMFLSLAAGFVLGLLVVAWREMKLRMRLAQERKAKALLEREVHELRAAPLQGLIEEGAPLPPARHR